MLRRALRATCCVIDLYAEHVGDELYCIAKAPAPHHGAMLYAVTGHHRDGTKAMVTPGFLAQPAAITGIARALHGFYLKEMARYPSDCPTRLRIRRLHWEASAPAPSLNPITIGPKVLEVPVPEPPEPADFERGLQYIVDVVASFQPDL